jgi:O-acetyl-ADP-ribose deacetylase (regulator of RNase III)
VFRVAATADIMTIAFPAISTGAYGFPKRAAAEIALGVMRRHEARYDRIVAALFDDESVAIYRRL